MAIFDFLRHKKETGPLDAKGLRELILQFVKEELQKLDGAEGATMDSLQLFVQANQEERFLYDVALYKSQPEKLQEEIQRTADNFALDLPEQWKLTVEFVDELPAGSLKKEGLKLALLMKNIAAPVVNTLPPANGLITVIKGDADQSAYVLKAIAGRINIGRGKSVSLADGGIRSNQIAFPEDPGFEFNKYISRQQAHIEWDKSAGVYKLFADEGGVPPSNKTKIKTFGDETTHKLNSTNIGYPLHHGDQIILADIAVLEFTIN